MNRIKRSFLCLMTYPFILSGTLLAEDPKAEIPDYTTAHEKLIALGLPVLPPSAKWATLSSPGRRSGGTFQVNPKGTGWLIANADGTEFQTLGWDEISFGSLSAEAVKKLQSGKPAILQEDIVLFQKALTKLKTSDSDQLRGYFEYNSGEVEMAKILIFATQLRQMGHGAEANSLTHQVLSINPAFNEQIIDGAVSFIADSQYEKITEQFSQDHNWITYEEKLRAMLTRFPRGWKMRDAIALCLEPTGRRARNEPPPALAITDPKLRVIVDELLRPPPAKTEEKDSLIFHGVDLRQYPENQRDRVKQQILHAVAQGYNMGSQNKNDSFQEMWLLNKVEATEKSDAITRLQSMGLDALPALAAMIEDPTLTHLIYDSNNDHNNFMDSSSSNARQLHSMLRRPTSRGEIALRLLRITLPDATGNLDQTPPEDLAKIALEFWKTHKDGKKWDLVMAFMAGDQSQQHSAIQTLMESDEPAAHAILEKNILSMGEPIQHFEAVVEYLRKNPKATPQFIEEYKKQIRSAAASTGSGNRHNYFNSDEERKAYFDSMLKRLDALTNRQSPQQIIAEILQGDPKNAENAVNSLMDVLGEQPAADSLLLLLQSAIAAKDSKITIAFLSAISELEFEEEEGEGEEEIEAKEVKMRPLSDEEKALWKQLFADTRTHVTEGRGAKSTTVAHIAATILYITISKQDFYAVQEWAPVLKVSAEELTRTRATNLLEGKPLPPWPDATKVSEARMKEIVKSIEEKTPQEIITILGQLNPDETAAWMTWIQDPGEIPQPASLKNMKRALVGRSTAMASHLTDDPKVDGLANGFQVTGDSLLRWAEELSKDMEKKSRTAVWMHINPVNKLGLHIASQQLEIPAAQKEEGKKATRQEYYKLHQFLSNALRILQSEDEVTAVTVLKVQKNRSEVTVVWQLADGKVVRDENFSPDDLTQILAVDDSGDEDRVNIQLQILHRNDYEKIKELMK